MGAPGGDIGLQAFYDRAFPIRNGNEHFLQEIVLDFNTPLQFGNKCELVQNNRFSFKLIKNPQTDRQYQGQFLDNSCDT